MRPVIVLHGAWHQPAHYDDVVVRLRDAGVEVHVPDLGGHSLAEGTTLAQELVDDADHPVVLAHSFGGVTACGLQRVAHLLFMTSFIFDIGESPQNWIERVSRETGRSAAPLPMSVDDAGLTVLDPAGAREGLFADCTDDVAERALGLLRPEPMTIFSEAPERASWKEVPSTYLAASEDRAIVPEMVARFSERCTSTVTLPTGHSPYLSRPEAVTAFVLDRL